MANTRPSLPRQIACTQVARHFQQFTSHPAHPSANRLLRRADSPQAFPLRQVDKLTPILRKQQVLGCFGRSAGVPDTARNPRPVDDDAQLPEVTHTIPTARSTIAAAIQSPNRHLFKTRRRKWRGRAPSLQRHSRPTPSPPRPKSRRAARDLPGSSTCIQAIERGQFRAADGAASKVLLDRQTHCVRQFTVVVCG